MQVAHEGFHGLDGGKFVELLAEDDDAGQLVGVVKVFLPPGGGFGDVDGREDTLVGDGAVEMDLHVARPFEFLENKVIHAALGLDQGRGHDGQAAAFLRVARRAEKFFRLHEGLRVDTAGHDASFARLEVVVAAGQTRDAVEKDDHIPAELHEAFGAFADEFRELRVALRGLVEGGTVNVGLDRPAQVRDLFRTFVDQKQDEAHLWRGGTDGLRDMLHQDRLARPGRRDDEGALAFAQRGDQIDRTGAEGRLFDRLQDDALLGKEGRELVERGDRLPLRGGDPLDRGDSFQSAIAVPLARSTNGAADLQPGLESELPHQADGDKEVVRSGGEVVARPTDHGVVAEVLDHAALGGDFRPGGQQEAGEVEDEMPLGAVGPDAQAVALQQSAQLGMVQSLQALHGDTESGHGRFRRKGIGTPERFGRG